MLRARATKRVCHGDAERSPHIRLRGFPSQLLRHYLALFVWNIWCYRYGTYKQFSMLDFYHIVQLQQLNFYHPEQTLEHLRHLVNAKINRLQKQFPQGRTTYNRCAKSYCS